MCVWFWTQQQPMPTAPDAHHPARLSTIAFGSCHNPRKRPITSPWTFIADQNPDLFVWSGDVTYSKGNSLHDLQLAYNSLPRDYLDFAASHRVVGTWDDHDYGVNMGGKKCPTGRRGATFFWIFLA